VGQDAILRRVVNPPLEFVHFSSGGSGVQSSVGRI
jgi:hypothetical protein